MDIEQQQSKTTETSLSWLFFNDVLLGANFTENSKFLKWFSIFILCCWCYYIVDCLENDELYRFVIYGLNLKEFVITLSALAIAANVMLAKTILDKKCYFMIQF